MHSSLVLVWSICIQSTVRFWCVPDASIHVKMAVEAKDIQWSKVFFCSFLDLPQFSLPLKKILCSPDFQEKSDFVLQRWFSPQVPSRNSCTQNFWFFFVILIPWLGITFCCFGVILMCIQKWFSRRFCSSLTCSDTEMVLAHDLSVENVCWKQIEKLWLPKCWDYMR